MGFSYEVQLSAYYSDINIKQILTKGFKQGFRYFPVDSMQEFINLDLATAALMTANAYTVHSIRGRIDDNVIHIVVLPKEKEIKKLSLIIGDFYNIDSVKYMKIFVDMTSDFAVYDIQMVE